MTVSIGQCTVVLLDDSQHRTVHSCPTGWQSAQDSAEVCEFVKIGSVKVMLADGSESISTHSPHIYCPLLVQFCATDVHIKLSDIASWTTVGAGKAGPSLLPPVTSHVPYLCAVELYDISTVKNALVKSVSYVTVFTICRSAAGLSNKTETLRTHVYLHLMLVYCRAT